MDKDDSTGEVLGKDKTYAMALDPGKWGQGISKATFKKSLLKLWDLLKVHNFLFFTLVSVFQNLLLQALKAIKE